MRQEFSGSNKNEKKKKKSMQNIMFTEEQVLDIVDKTSITNEKQHGSIYEFILYKLHARSTQ